MNFVNFSKRCEPSFHHHSCFFFCKSLGEHQMKVVGFTWFSNVFVLVWQSSSRTSFLACVPDGQTLPNRGMAIFLIFLVLSESIGHITFWPVSCVSTLPRIHRAGRTQPFLSSAWSVEKCGSQWCSFFFFCFFLVFTGQISQSLSQFTMNHLMAFVA